MKTAVSITLLLAVVSASAVGVGYVLRRHSQAAAPATSAGTTPSTTTPTSATLPAPAQGIVAGEPTPGMMYAGGSATFDEATGTYLGAAAAASTPADLGSWFDSIVASLPKDGSSVTLPVVRVNA